jgi:gliding motility-associated-like protein
LVVINKLYPVKKILLRFLVLGLFITYGSQSNAQVVASFTASPTSGCAPLLVNFTDNSTGAPTTWSWNFGNGNTSSLKNPGTTYATPGTYTVTLTASKSGSSNTTTKTITVFAKPTANFTTNITTTACVDQIVNFTDASTAVSGTITGWKWDFGDGSAFSTLGNPSHSYNTSGTKQVTLTVTSNNGCPENITKSIIVLPKPVAAFSGTPLSACVAPLNVTYTNSSTGSGTVSYLWDFGDGSGTSTTTAPSHSYNALGNYNVTLTITQGGCTSTLTKPNYISVKNTVADFSADTTSICVGKSVKFTDLTSPASTSRTWNFGDASATSALANPTHVYNTVGTFSVSLNATANGCTDPEVKNNYITVLPLPTVNFKADTTRSCSAPFTVNFTDSSSAATSWLWNFGDGNTSTLQNPSHTYILKGNYTVKLTVTNANGCTNILTKAAYIVISPPIAAFSATPREGCIPLSVNFTNSSTSAIDNITAYHWDFGNGNTANSTVPNPTSLYTLNSYYNVKLVITTASGCKDSITKNNYVKSGVPPVANFSVVDSTVCFGLFAQFHDLSTGGADSLYWTFENGAGNVSTKSPPVPSPVIYSYGNPGVFNVQLIAYNKGCPNTLTQNNMVTIMPPKPIFTSQLNCATPYTVKLTDASIGADSLSWDFGDGQFDNTNTANPSHNYTSTGSKTAVLTAYNYTSGCSFKASSTFTIADSVPQYTVSASKGCYPLTVKFTNTTLYSDTTKIKWNFGNGMTSTAKSPTITYNTAKLYTDTLTITNLNGCKSSITGITNVFGPTPKFTADTLVGCTPLTVHFTDNSISDSSLVRWTWNFGDGTGIITTNSPTVSHTYTNPSFSLPKQLFPITMTVKDTNQCSKQKTDSAEVTHPVAQFTLSKSFACKGNSVSFTATATGVVSSTGKPATYFWDFGDGTDSARTVNTINHVFTKEGIDTVKLVVTDKNGCTNNIIHIDTIQTPIAGIKADTISQGCGFSDIQFTDISQGYPGSITSYLWTFGDSVTSTLQNPLKNFPKPGAYKVTLTVTNKAGCTNTITRDSLIVVPGPIGTFSFTPKVGCNPLEVTFTASISTKNAVPYEWDFGDGVKIPTTDTIITHTYTKDGVSTPFLTLIDANNCKNSIDVNVVTVSTNMTVDIDTTNITLAQDEQFNITSQLTGGYGGTPTYSWVPTDQLSCPTCETPFVVGSGTGSAITYTLTVKDGSCVSQDIITVLNTYCEDDAYIKPNVFTPNGDGVNDLFKFTGICDRNTYTLKIYDRWGILMFATSDKNINWDGRTTSGKEASEGVYYYIIGFENGNKPQTGFVELVR